MAYCTYFYNRTDGTPYYVGKGTKLRAFQNHDSQGIFRPKGTARIFIQYWGSETEAFEMEKWWIKFWGRKDLGIGILHNKTEGGEGVSGWRASEENKRNMSESAKKKPPMSEKTKEKVKAALRGRPVSEETRRKIGESQLGKVVPEEVGRKISAAKLGKPSGRKGEKHTLEARRKMSEAHRGQGIGRKDSPEVRVRKSAAQKGRTFSEAHRRKLSEAQKQRFLLPISKETRKRLSIAQTARHARNRAERKKDV